MVLNLCAGVGLHECVCIRTCMCMCYSACIEEYYICMCICIDICTYMYIRKYMDVS